ncbi:hypothetical protein J2Z83_000724 [Virgibacillus natechei]|uniref:YfhE family protein n=1 Tax=Virgibacillus natechei TaxID=1216297 RepID=A0ABS4ICG6_9BACI|nr:YfhE family protein [Virgibacillus natechei]MBP1968632.1 hypothetical protein [Virgibacillus natechei]UZD13737.1 YfhE family protein [Virgibacillus natechei]
MAKSQYQPAGNNQQLSDAQEVHYSREFKRADAAGGYRKQQVREAKQ